MTTTFTRISVSASLALALLLSPVSAFAYLSPDQVFGSSNTHQAAGTSAVESPFPTKRDAESYAQAQQALANQRRAEIQNAELKSVDAVPVDTYVAPEPMKPASRLDPDTAYQIRMQRMADETSNSPSIIIAGQGTVVDSNGNVLHSGAPIITGTGPASVFAFIALTFSAIMTYAMTVLRRREMSL